MKASVRQPLTSEKNLKYSGHHRVTSGTAVVRIHSKTYDMILTQLTLNSLVVSMFAQTFHIFHIATAAFNPGSFDFFVQSRLNYSTLGEKTSTDKYVPVA